MKTPGFDEDFDDDDDLPDYTPPPASIAAPPEDLKLTVEVGLTQYLPNGLLGFIAGTLIKDIGGRDKWVGRFRKLLEQEGKSKLSGLIDSEAALLFQDHRAELRTLIEQGFKSYFEDEKLAAEAVDQAWKEIEAETKARWVADIKAVVTDLMAARVERALPPPKLGQT